MKRKHSSICATSALLLLLLAISVEQTLRYENHSQSARGFALSAARGRWQSLGELFSAACCSLLLLFVRKLAVCLEQPFATLRLNLAKRRLSLKRRLFKPRRWLEQRRRAAWWLLGCAGVVCCNVASEGESSSLGTARLASDRTLPPHCSSLLSAEPCAFAWWAFVVVGVAAIALLRRALRRPSEPVPRVTLIHRLEAGQRRLAWIKYGQTNDVNDLPICRQNDNNLLTDYEGVSTAELEARIAAVRALEQQTPLAFDALAEELDRRDRGEQYKPSLKWRARQCLDRQRCRWRALRLQLAACVRVALALLLSFPRRCFARLRGLLLNLRWQLVGIATSIALAQFEQEAAVEVVTVAAFACIHTVMLARLIVELVMRQSPIVGCTLSVPVAFFLHSFAASSFADALLPLTLPLLLEAMTTFLHTQAFPSRLAIVFKLTLPSAPLFLLDTPAFVSHLSFAAVSIALQSATIRRGVGAAPLAACAVLQSKWSRSSWRLRYTTKPLRAAISSASSAAWNIFDEFTGVEFDSSLGYPGEGPPKQQSCGVEEFDEDVKMEEKQGEQRMPVANTNSLLMQMLLS